MFSTSVLIIYFLSPFDVRFYPLLFLRDNSSRFSRHPLPYLSTIIVIDGHNTSSRVFAKVNIFVSNIFRRYSNELNDRFIDKR